MFGTLNSIENLFSAKNGIDRFLHRALKLNISRELNAILPAPYVASTSLWRVNSPHVTSQSQLMFETWLHYCHVTNGQIPGDRNIIMTCICLMRRVEHLFATWKTNLESKDCFLLCYVKYLTKKIYILWGLISLLFHHTSEHGWENWEIS